MKIISLSFENFRQFYGTDNTIYFAKRKNKNVTLIFGANGAGKSTVLNGFTWCLFRQTTPSFENPERLLNDQATYEAQVGDTVEARVTVVFEHDNQRYTARRTRAERKTAHPNEMQVLKEGMLDVWIVGEDGKTRTPNNPQDLIEQVLPDRLHSFFFFDGERIERLTRLNGGTEVEKAIKDLLGLELIERSMKHLNGEVKRRLDAELGRVATVELQKLLENIEQLTQKKETDEAALGLEQKNLESERQNLEDVETQLLRLRETAELQGRLKRLSDEEHVVMEKIAESDGKIRALLSRWAYVSFTTPLAARCQSVLEDARQKGEIPAPIKKQFVSDLLQRGECICGEKLRQGTSHYESVKAWLDRAGVADVEEAAMNASAQLRLYAQHRETFHTTLQELQATRESDSRKLRELREEMSEVESQLDDQGRKSEEIDELTKRRTHLKRRLDEINQKIGSLTEIIKTTKDQLSTMEKEKERAKLQNAQAERIQSQLKLVREAAEFFENLYQARSGEVREELDRRVKGVYQKIAYTGNWPELTADYRLVVKKGLGSEEDIATMDVAKSTGENQLLSLSFIGSIANYARERYEKYRADPEKEGLGFPGGIYPMVMDSPFGSLDENYRSPLASGLPTLADQIIILVSKGQGLGTVFEAIEQHIGKTYVLSRHTPKESGNESIRIQGKTVPYLKYSREERVTITEIE